MFNFLFEILGWWIQWRGLVDVWGQLTSWIKIPLPF